MNQYKEIIGYIIHIREFKNSSVIFEFYGKETGLIHILAKGIKKNKSSKQYLHNFNLLQIQYFGKSQLKTLISIDEIETHNIERLMASTAGLYLNELLRFSLTENHQDNRLFICYQQAIKRLENNKITPLLRNFEREILKYNGYELTVNGFLNEHDWLMFNDTTGMTITEKTSEKLCTVLDMKNFLQEEKIDPETQYRINAFMLSAINVCFSYRKIHSRELLKSIAKLSHRSIDVK